MASSQLRCKSYSYTPRINHAFINEDTTKLLLPTVLKEEPMSSNLKVAQFLSSQQPDDSVDGYFNSSETDVLLKGSQENIQCDRYPSLKAQRLTRVKTVVKDVM